MRLPKISLVIPSLNKAEFIGRTLQSILDQNYQNLEVIIRDGGSTDGTVEIIKKFSRKYPAVFFWEIKKDSGQLEAINEGLKNTTGEIVTYLNADDIYRPGALIAVGKYFATHPNTPWLVGKGEIVDEEGKIISSFATDYKNFLFSQNKYELLLMVNYLMQPSVFLNRKAYKKYGPFTGTAASVMEYDLWLKIGKIIMPAILDRVLSSFSVYQGSISTSQYKEVLLADERIAEKYTDSALILMLHYLHNIARVIIVKFHI